MKKVKALVASLWAKFKEDVHLKGQITRFVRLVAVTLASSGVFTDLLHGGLSRSAAIAAVVGAVEVGVRQVWPVAAKALEKK